MHPSSSLGTYRTDMHEPREGFIDVDTPPPYGEHILTFVVFFVFDTVLALALLIGCVYCTQFKLEAQLDLGAREGIRILVYASLSPCYVSSALYGTIHALFQGSSPLHSKQS
ncbi:hypothetical protein K438DRAFT_1861337 [Mycena galopus ATCC 62051]|nr:hypothetical protein K438DRAFT_1861337 [Mycena galopus ATCC 62051]